MIQIPTTIEGVRQWLRDLSRPSLSIRTGPTDVTITLEWDSGLSLASGGHESIEEAMTSITALYEDYVVASTERP